MLRQLRGNEMIVTESGELTNITALYQVPGGRVYIMELANTNQEPQILANGLVTVDFSLQNHPLRNCQSEDCRQAAASEDAQRLQAFFAEGK